MCGNLSGIKGMELEEGKNPGLNMAQSNLGQYPFKY